jgi:hypothetical protein
LPLAHALVNVGLPGANRAEDDDVRVRRFGHLGHRNRLCMDILSDRERARLGPGWPPMFGVQVSP